MPPEGSILNVKVDLVRLTRVPYSVTSSFLTIMYWALESLI